MSHHGYPQNAAESLGLRIGPFSYLFHAYCSWGRDILNRLSLHLERADIASFKDPDRQIHLVALPDDDIPGEQLRGRIAEDLCKRNWQSLQNRINSLWVAGGTRHVIWTRASVAGLGSPRFEFPWSLLIMDITSRGGGLVHAGLACHRGSGLLFLAPPAGGKTTTLSSAPADWQILSDDAALVWPGAAGRWLASPLPAWGLVSNPDRAWSAAPMVLNTSCEMKSLLILLKAPTLSLTRIVGSSAMPHVYRALSEYPVTIIAGDTQAQAWFRASARLCRELLCWELRLPLHAEIWPLLAREAA